MIENDGGVRCRFSFCEDPAFDMSAVLGVQGAYKRDEECMEKEELFHNVALVFMRKRKSIRIDYQNAYLFDEMFDFLNV